MTLEITAAFGVVVAGAVGGFFNALATDRGLIWPKFEELSDSKVWRPGFIGNMLVGSLGAFFIHALYDFPANELTLGKVASALLVGLGGSRVLAERTGRKVDMYAKENISEGNALLEELLDQVKQEDAGDE